MNQNTIFNKIMFCSPKGFAVGSLLSAHYIHVMNPIILPHYFDVLKRQKSTITQIKNINFFQDLY